MAMMPDGEIVPLTEEAAREVATTGRIRGVAVQLVRIGDVVNVNGRDCRVRKVTDKDIILRPVPTA